MVRQQQSGQQKGQHYSKRNCREHHERGPSNQWEPATAIFCDDCGNTSGLFYKDATVSLTITDENGCTATDSFEVIIGDDCFGLGGIFGYPPPPPPDPQPLPGTGAPDDLRLYPNPARSVLTVEWRGAAIRRLQVFDAGGALQWETTQPFDLQREIELRGWSPGAYWLRVVTEREVVGRQFLIIK